MQFGKMHTYFILGLFLITLILTFVVLILKRRLWRGVSNQELQNANRKMELILNTAPDAFIIINSKGYVQEWNTKAENILGWKRSEVLGKKLSSIIISLPDQQVIEHDLKEIFFNGKTPIFSHLIEVQATHRDGHEIPVELSISVLQDKTNYSFNIFVRDITERKKAERMKEDFISTVSHELRSPLTVIKSAVGNLKDGIMGPLTPKQLQVIEVTCRNANRLANLINNLLDFSRLESGKARINKTELQLDKLVTEVISNYQDKAKQKNICLINEVPLVFTRAYGDADMILQVIENLITNALRFAKNKISIKAFYASQSGPFNIKPVNSGIKNFIRISVKDDGPGISQANIHKLFSKFEQIKRSQEGDGYKGTGLGLAICKEIIQLHQGKIWVESVLGEGSEFFFDLPEYDSENHFRLTLDEIIKLSVATKHPMALVALSLTNLNEVKSKFSDLQMKELFLSIEKQVRTYMLRPRDLIYHYRFSNFMVIISDSGREEGKIVGKRIEELISKTILKKTNDLVNPKIKLGISVYPTEVQNLDNMILQALDEAN